LAVRTMAERPVTLLTYDTGQSTRARNAGLKVVKPVEDVGPEPTSLGAAAPVWPIPGLHHGGRQSVIMLIAPRLGVNLDNLIPSLQTTRDEAFKLHGSGGGPAGRLRAAGLGALADLGFTGLDPDPEDPVIITGYKATRTRKTTPAQRRANQALSAARAPVEHGFSDLKNWRALTRLRIDPGNATALLRALLVLTRQHATR
jgi:hypothetical protein